MREDAEREERQQKGEESEVDGGRVERDLDKFARSLARAQDSASHP